MSNIVLFRHYPIADLLPTLSVEIVPIYTFAVNSQPPVPHLRIVINDAAFVHRYEKLLTIYANDSVYSWLSSCVSLLNSLNGRSVQFTLASAVKHGAYAIDAYPTKVVLW